MKRVFIKYNPYQVTTEITIDDQPLKKNSKLNVPDQRLQEWVDNLPDLLFEECSTKDFEITFCLDVDNKLQDNKFKLVFDEKPTFDGEEIEEDYGGEIYYPKAA